MNAGLRHLARARRDAEVAVLDHGAERIELSRAHQPLDVGAFRVRTACGFADGFAQLVHRALDARQADFAGTGQRDAGATPQQQRRAEVAFQARDGLRDRGL